MKVIRKPFLDYFLLSYDPVMFIPPVAINKEIDFYPQSWGGAVSFQVYKMRLTFAIIIIIGFMNVGLSKGGMVVVIVHIAHPLCYGILLCDIQPPLALGFKSKGHDKKVCSSFQNEAS